MPERLDSRPEAESSMQLVHTFDTSAIRHVARHSLSDGSNLAEAKWVSRIVKGRQQGVKADPRRLLGGTSDPVRASELQHSN